MQMPRNNAQIVDTCRLKNLSDYRGVFVEGHTPVDVYEVLDGFQELTDLTVVVLWETMTNGNPQGDCSYYLQVRDKLVEAPNAVVDFLLNLDSDVDPMQLTRMTAEDLYGRDGLQLATVYRRDEHNAARTASSCA